MAARLSWLAMLLILSLRLALGCEWRVVQDDAGFFFLELIGTTAHATHYFYAAVVPFDQPVTSLDDVKSQGSPLGRSAERRMYAMPQNLRHGTVYLMSSPVKLNGGDRFRIVPRFAQQENAPRSSTVVPSPSKGMTDYGGPLPTPRFTKPEGDWPANVSVCATRW